VRLHRWAWIAALALSVVALPILVTIPTHASERRAVGASAPHRPGIDIIAQRGFGDSRNSMSWSMAWFKGKLYVGTSRNQVCVERATVNFYFPRIHWYRTNPGPNVRCPPRWSDLHLRAEIWQYNPRTRRWRRVFQSPANVPNLRADGRFVGRDIAFRGMVVYRDRRGHQALYVGGVTADEFLPENKLRYPPRILRTRDGVHFHSIGAPRLVRWARDTGDFRPIGFRSMLVWKRRLFVTATGGLTGDGAIFEVRQPWARRARFRQISPPTLRVFEMEAFNGALYAGTGDSKTGYGVWKTRGLTHPFRFKAIVRNGAGRGVTITSVVSMHVFRGELYVGSSGWYNANEIPNSELIRISRDDRWALVAGRPRMGDDGVWRSPISGLRDGFENMFNAHFWRMADDHGALYVGTNDWSYLVQINKDLPVLQSLLAGEFGFDLWASCDGRDWFPVTRDAFGGNLYDFGGRTLTPSPAGFFIGSANNAQGTTVWNDRAPACSSLVRAGAARASSAAARRVPLPPQRLLVDEQRHGTVVSWVPSQGAVRYRVLRAAYETVPLSITAPPPLPTGFRLEGEVPDVTPTGSPGSSQVDIAVLGPSEVVGATTRSYFVDRGREPGRRYAYSVIAEAPSGARSAPSNVQVVPDPRPAATFEGLRRQMARAGASRLARAAMAQWRRRDRAGTVRALERVRRAARDDDVRELAYRLARRIRYGDVTGGP
jgi:hypothetical protein